MRCANSYSPDYIHASRRQIEAQVSADRRMVAAGADLTGSSRAPFAAAAI